MSQYLNEIITVLQKIETEEADKLAKASRLVADTIKNGGLIYTFGCGHSHLPGLDAFTAQAVLPMYPRCWTRI